MLSEVWYNYSDGTKYVTYRYDAWGNTQIVYSNGGASITAIVSNPIRYRGYYYDTDLGLYYLQTRYYDSNIGRFINADSAISGVNESLNGYNLYAYCFNNPIALIDSSGNWPSINDLVSAYNNVEAFVIDNIINPVETIVTNIVEDIDNYNKDNTDVDKVYNSHYFSSYKNVLVLRHNSDFLTSWGLGETIFLNHSHDAARLSKKTEILNHEYGHVQQEKELGTVKYLIAVFIPSAMYNLASRCDSSLSKLYYSMPWEYDADARGGIDRGYESWAESVSKRYFDFWR